MADYYPLLAKAVAGLPDASPHARQAIYERARNALLGQLRRVQPPIAEADIQHEDQVLNECITRLELEIAQRGQPAQNFTPPIPKAPVYAPVQQAQPEPAFRTPVAAPRAPAPVRPPLTPKPTSQPRPSADRLAGSSQGAASTRTSATPDSAFDPKWQDQDMSSAEPTYGGTGLLVRPRGDAMRPAAPMSEADKGASLRRWVLGIVIGVMVLAVAGFNIWLKKENLDDLARLRPAASPIVIEAAPSKNSERVGTSRTDTQGPRAATPSAGNQATAQGTGPATPPAPYIPVAQRAALLVQSTEDPQKVNTFTGTVVWRLDTIVSAPGKPAGSAIRADIEIPEARFNASLLIQKSADPASSASHTIELRFAPQPGSVLPGVKDITMPQLRKEDVPNGDPLLGLPLPVRENFFIIGLTKGEAETRNMDILAKRPWIDVQLALTNGKIAKLTFEKGASGERVLKDALDVWSRP